LDHFNHFYADDFYATFELKIYQEKISLDVQLVREKEKKWIVTILQSDNK